jgi:hypothetical protein
MRDDQRSTAPWRGVAWTMAAGAAFDAGFGVGLLFFHRAAGRLFGIEPPGDPVYLRLVGLLLVILAAIYALAGRDPRRYAAVVPIAAVGRLAGAVYFAVVWLGGAPPAFAGFAVSDLGLALWHARAFAVARRGGG